MTFQLENDEKEFLKAVDAKIAHVLSLNDKYLKNASRVLRDVASHLCLTSSAKRVRPLLTLYFANATNNDPVNLIDAAAASEILHSASLLHDDVIDNAHTRRGNPSANAKWSNSVAVLSGNYLICQAFDLLSAYPVQLTRDGVRVIGDMTKAAMAEIEMRNSMADISLWREIAIGKTGALFGMCGLASARINQNEDVASRIVKCANHIGIIFQMTDDVIDITDESGLKDRYSDILNKEPSFPLILAAQDPEIKKAISSAWALESITPDIAEKIGNQIIKSGAILRAKNAIDHELNAAVDSLGALSETSGGKRIIGWLHDLRQCI